MDFNAHSNNVLSIGFDEDAELALKCDCTIILLVVNLRLYTGGQINFI